MFVGINKNGFFSLSNIPLTTLNVSVIRAICKFRERKSKFETSIVYTELCRENVFIL